jgi:hypothetical protein
LHGGEGTREHANAGRGREEAAEGSPHALITNSFLSKTSLDSNLEDILYSKLSALVSLLAAVLQSLIIGAYFLPC